MNLIPPNPAIISPKPYREGVPNVPIGYDPTAAELGIAPPPNRTMPEKCCNLLPSSPRNQNDPTATKCPPKNIFGSKSEFGLMYSPAQNMWGAVCENGGSNSNWVRGGLFGNALTEQNDAVGIYQQEYIKKNPVVVATTYNYPPSQYKDENSPAYKEYTPTAPYIGKHPAYVFPYDTVNKPESQYHNPDQVGNLENVETFAPLYPQQYYQSSSSLIITIILVSLCCLIAAYFTKRRR